MAGHRSTRARKFPNQLYTGTQLTNEVYQRIVTLLKNGNFFETACMNAGVIASRTRIWMKTGAEEYDRRERGKKADPKLDIYVSFWGDVMSAMAEAEHRNVTQLQVHAQTDYRANVEFLKRRYPKRWGDRVNIAVEEELTNALDKLEKSLDPATFTKVLRALTDSTGESPT